MADHAADERGELIEAAPVFSPVAESDSGPVLQAPPSRLNDRERQRIDQALAGLEQFRPIAEPQRPAPRTDVDTLSAVSAADWSGLDGAPEAVSISSPEPSKPAPIPDDEPAPIPIPESDPVRGWVTAESLFAGFGD